MNRKICGTAGLLVSLAIASSAGAEGSVNPSLNLAPGDYYVCSMEMTKRLKQTIDNEDQLMEQNLLLVWDYRIQSKDDQGNYRISAKYARVKSSQRFGMQTVEFDSDNMPDYIDPSIAGLKLMVGMELEMEVTPGGRVIRLEGFQGLVDKLIEELNIPESPRRDEIINNIRNQFGDEAMRQSFEQMTAFYPGRPVDAGEQWHAEMAVDLGFPIIIESDYTLVSRKDGIAEIDVVSKVRSNPNAGEIDMGMFSLSYNIEGTQKGLIKMDEASGLPVRSDIQQDFAGDVSVSEAPDLQERSWPISGEGTITISFEKRR